MKMIIVFNVRDYAGMIAKRAVQMEILVWNVKLLDLNLKAIFVLIFVGMGTLQLIPLEEIQRNAMILI